MTDGKPDTEETATMSFADFLVGAPPGSFHVIVDFFSKDDARRIVSSPDIELYCENEKCQGVRTFRFYSDRPKYLSGDRDNLFLTYRCGNCHDRTKIYSLHAKIQGQNGGLLYKFGEVPPFGPHTPARLVRLLQEEKDNFLKGRRCETQGLGIGAFAYYRRVVENQKDKIIEEVIKTCRKLGAEPSMISSLNEAKKEIQFSKAMESLKNAVPQALLINGHNPLTLLHSAVGLGLHSKTDEECLSYAQHVQTILIELADKIGSVLKEQKALDDAVNALMQARSK